MPRASLDSSPRPLLSPAELRVLRGLARGRNLRELAADLHYSYSYVREVASSACSSLGAKTVCQAVYVAARRGLF